MLNSFCFSVIGVTGNIIATFKHGLINGGPIFIVFGWLIASFFTFIVGISFKKLYLWLKFALYSLSLVPFTFGKKTYLKIKNISYF